MKNLELASISIRLSMQRIFSCQKKREPREPIYFAFNFLNWVKSFFFKRLTMCWNAKFRQWARIGPPAGAPVFLFLSGLLVAVKRNE